MALKHLALIGVLASIVGLLATARADTLSDHVELCVACRGEHGVPQDKSIPVIDGQQQGYLYLQGTEPMRGLTASLLN